MVTNSRGKNNNNNKVEKRQRKLGSDILKRVNRGKLFEKMTFEQGRK